MRSLSAIALTLFALSADAEAPGVDRLNKKINDFSLPAAAGKDFSLASLKEKKAVVAVFLSFDCPVSTAYSPTLAKLHEKYAAKGVAFIGIASSDDLTPAQLAKQAEEYKLPFPVYKDEGQKVADLFKAAVAPEAFVLDHNRVMRYRGRIDNAYHARLRKNAQTTEHDLDNAVADLLAGRAVKVPATKAIGCPIQRADGTKAGGKVTYYRDVLPILQAACQQCHRPGEVGPFSLMTYRQAKNWAADIKDYTRSRKMPPFKAEEGGPFHNDRKLSERDIRTLAAWADGGAPEGDPKDAPKPRTFTEGWQLGKPDLVLTVPSDVTIGASGADAFRCFVLPTGLTEEKHVTAIEIRPGNNRIVHHSLNFFDTTGKARELEKKERERKKKPGEQDSGPGYAVSMGIGFTAEPGKIGGLGGWAPGQMPRYLPEGYGYPLPKGSDVVLQLHYHRNGRVEKDRTSIGLYFAKKEGIKPYKAVVLRGNFLLLPPGKSDIKIDGGVKLLEDVEVHSVMPHMHMLGRKIKVTMTPPGGEPEVLVGINDWDYNWQETYFLKEPRKAKKGTIFRVEAVYDNSAGNPNNPFNPPQRVWFGEQTDMEMCFAFLGVTSDATPRRVQWETLPITVPKKSGDRR